MKNMFGLLEHLFFYGIFISLILFIFTNSIEFVYFAIISWFISFFSHILEHKFENRSNRKILIGV